MGDQGWVFPDRFRALRPVRLPHLQAQVEDGQGDRWQEDGGSSLPEVERDAWKGHLVREEGGGRRWRQEEVIAFRLPRTWDALCTAYAALCPANPSLRPPWKRELGMD